ncbi:MAG: efflux RND transporter periplasmic adaptor subunit [Smithellaceae bacterium]
MKKWIIAVVIVMLIAIGAIALLKKKDEAPQYTTQKILRGNIRASVSATGTVNAVTTVLVGTQVSGTVKELFADFNSQVKQGQLLAQIDPSTFEAQVDQARANLSLTEANLEKAKVALRDTISVYERNKTLFSKNFISQHDLDVSETSHLSALAQIKAAEAQKRQAQASLQIARSNLQYTRIVSPVNGTVISRSVDVGQTVAASFQTPTLFTIAQDLTKMQIKTSVDEADIGKIQTNQPVTFTVDAYPEMTFNGHVSEIRNAPTTVQNVVTYDVIVNVDNPDLKLKPGMTANVSIIIADKKDILRVPNAALRVRITDPTLTADTPKGPGVWVLENKTPKRVALSLGYSDNRFTEVTSGDISESDAVIVEVRTSQTNTAGQSAGPRGPGFIR